VQAQLKEIKIAVIEDDIPICTMYELKLKNAGFSVKTAHNGKTGLALCEQFRPNLILLDQRMPEMNGDEMLAKLRESDWGASMRVIILTNISKDEAPQSLRVLNIDRYIVKAHYTPAQIIDVVKDVLSLPA
jgi:DNA-binding response OmpR family regulator